MPDLSADRPLPLPKIKGFTEEDVRIMWAARMEHAFDGEDVCICGFRPVTMVDWEQHFYRAGLEALAAAGRLMPPDAEHREEWTAVLTDRTSGRVTTWKPRPSEEDLRNSLRRLAVDDWDVEVQLHRRAVVFAAGPWVEVEDTSEETSE